MILSARDLRTVGLWAMVLVVVSLSARSSCAQQPVIGHRTSVDAMWGYSVPTSPATYAILARPQPLLKSQRTPETHIATTPILKTRPIEPYAYGWFGAKPSPHWYQQFGHQKSYTQWTLR